MKIQDVLIFSSMLLNVLCQAKKNVLLYSTMYCSSAKEEIRGYFLRAPYRKAMNLL